MSEPSARRSRSAGERTFRWICRCQDPPVLLATYDPNGRINIKVRDRYWHVVGQVQAICPKCGAGHILDLRGSNGPTAARGDDRPDQRGLRSRR